MRQRLALANDIGHQPHQSGKKQREQVVGTQANRQLARARWIVQGEQHRRHHPGHDGGQRRSRHPAATQPAKRRNWRVASAVNTLLTTHPGQAERDHYGQLLFDLFMHSSFVLQRLQTDPHPGNFLFMPGGQLGLLDFGCIRTLDSAFCDSLARAWCAVLRGPKDTPVLQAAYTQLGLIDPAMREAVFRTELLPALQAMQDWQCLPFRSTAYDFALLPLPPRPGAQHQQLMQHLRAVPPDLPYFDRAHLGLIQMLRAMGARVRTSNAWIF